MVWDPAEQDADLLAYITRLIDLRKQHPGLANASGYQFEQLNDASASFLIRRQSDEATYLILFNNGSEDVHFDLTDPTVDLMDGQRYTESVTVGGVSGKILQIEQE
jgi:glycosidase